MHGTLGKDCQNSKRIPTDPLGESSRALRFALHPSHTKKMKRTLEAESLPSDLLRESSWAPRCARRCAGGVVRPPACMDLGVLLCRMCGAMYGAYVKVHYLLAMRLFVRSCDVSTRGHEKTVLTTSVLHADRHDP